MRKLVQCSSSTIFTSKFADHYCEIENHSEYKDNIHNSRSEKERYIKVAQDVSKKNGTENRITDLPLRAVVISTCDTLICTALFTDGARKHKRRKNIPWNKTNFGVLPWLVPTSEYPIHQSE